MRVAIHQNKAIFSHSSLWNEQWVQYCKNYNIEYELVNCYDNDILQKLKNFDCLLWHFSNYVLQDMLFARSILQIAKQMGLSVFPDWNTSWHFDDKIAEMYLLQSINAPIPHFWVFYTLESCLDWIDTECRFPIIAKLRCGSGSNNVIMIHNKKEAYTYAKKMFSSGFKIAPNIFFKTKSNIYSSKNWDTFKKRFHRIPDFLQTLRNANKFPREKGYVFFQEYIPNDGFDIKMVVVNDKISYICRRSRGIDFRASGSGDLFFDITLISKEILNSAIQISNQLSFQSMGYDYVIDNRNLKGKIVEMSYGFSFDALLKSKGFWDGSHVWFDNVLNAPEEIIKNLVNDKHA